MKISYNWLKQYLDVDYPPEKVADLLTGCGLEVENAELFQSVKGGLKGVVIGEVLSCAKHPGSDHLSLTTVNIGSSEPLPIVCGAPNVAAGQKVAVATVGAVLYFNDKDVTIREAKIRGELSRGMICAEDELGLGTSHEGIMILSNEAVPGTPAASYFQVEEDMVFEIGLTPNRTDATSHTGVARDLAAVLNNRPGNGKSGRYLLNIPDVSAFRPDFENATTKIMIENPDACPRYSGLVIRNVKVGESPGWLKNKLNAIRVRPVNNIVDITNFVLHETGHPLHAFDADRIAGEKVIIKTLPAGTRFITLDGIDRELSDEDLMICDEKGPMCMAGIFGGLHSGVTMGTTNIFLESAYFNPASIRKSSRRHGLQTDASFRFERGADYDITVYALKRAAILIREVAGGEIASDVMDVYPSPIPKRTIRMEWKSLDRLSGIVIERDLAKNILASLGMVVLSDLEETLTLRIPAFKADVLREADIIEEILRIYGYDRIGFSSEIRSSVSFSKKPDSERVQNLISDFLTSNGFFEIMNNSLTKSAFYQESELYKKENLVKILNPLSADLDVMRQNLLFGGLETIAYNQNRKISDVKFFEFGNIYSFHGDNGSEGVLRSFKEEKHLALFQSGNVSKELWNTKQKETDFYDLKGTVMAILSRVAIPIPELKSEFISDEIFAGGLRIDSGSEEIGRLGILNEDLLRSFDCRQNVFYADLQWERVLSLLPSEDMKYAPVPKFPEVRRDLALLLDRSVSFSEIEKIALEAEKQILKKVSLFDVYEGDKIGKDKKSYALNFILQDENKTLKDEEIDRVMNRLMKAFREKINADIR